MVGIGADRPSPTRLFGASQRVVHDLFGRTARAGHLANRLLRENGQNVTTGGLHRRHMPWRGKSDSIAKAKAWGKAEHGTTLRREIAFHQAKN
jgi:hypothetical protein